MKKSSSNLRARAVQRYHRDTLYEFIPAEECDDTTVKEHLELHMDEFVANIGHLTNDTVKRSISLRESRGAYGLIDSGSRPVRRTLDARRFDDLLQTTLRCDLQSTLEQNPDVEAATNAYIDHIRPMDYTMRPTSALMILAGINTAIWTMSRTYTTLTSERFSFDLETLIASWKVILENAKIGKNELEALDRVAIVGDYAGRLYPLDDTGLASFCAHAIPKFPNRIPDRDTIGCPVTFEPLLVKALWEWYASTRYSIENAEMSDS